MARTKSQRENRRVVTLFDQHGRPWTTGIEKATGDPCGVLVPRFGAPWYPDATYIKLDPKNPTRLRIAYHQIEHDYQEALEAWQQRIRAEARRLPGVDAAEAVESPPQMLLDIVGPPPPSVLLPRAAARGSRWLLGFSFEKPKWAIPLFPDLADNPDAAFEGDDDDFHAAFEGDFDAEFDAEAVEDDDDEPVHLTARDRKAGAAAAVPGRTTRVSKRRPRPSKARGAQVLDPVTPDTDDDDLEDHTSDDEGELVLSGTGGRQRNGSAITGEDE